MCKPYTYFIKHKITGQFYYGVKYGKDADPSTFWEEYFTSSKAVHTIIERDGKEAFETQIRKIFDDPEKAYLWEQKVISKIINKDKCLNAALGFSFDPNKNRNIVGSDGLTNYQRCAKKASETMLNDICENGLNKYQRLAFERYERLGEAYKDKSKKSAQTMKKKGTYDEIAKKHKVFQNEIMPSGLTRAKETGQKVSETRKKLFKEGKLKKLEGLQNPMAKIIKIFNKNDDLVFTCYGNFDKICKENKLPVSFLKKSYQEGGIRFKKTKGMATEFFERHKQFEGWYAKVEKNE